jgi:hypothetical protein
VDRDAVPTQLGERPNARDMQAGLASRVLDIEDLAALVEARELQAMKAGAMKRGKCRAKNQD